MAVLPAQAADQCDVDPVDVHSELGHGINLSALEAPNEGEWGVALESRFFDIVAAAGFDSVRVPIRWSNHAAQAAPYTIDPTFFARVDWVLDQAQRAGLAVVINVHHYDGLTSNPPSHRARFLELWRQIARRYADRSSSVYFELLNEPTDAFNAQPELWNVLAADALAVVRQSNPQRTVIIGPVGWNAIDRLPELELPNDPNLLATVHFYEPFPFTHQGASWVSPVPPVGVSRSGDTFGWNAPDQDWSWDTDVSIRQSDVQISFGRQYAGFNIRSVAPINPISISLQIQGSARAGRQLLKGRRFY